MEIYYINCECALAVLRTVGAHFCAVFIAFMQIQGGFERLKYGLLDLTCDNL